ncbi:MAG: 2-amino-4-hydroxy-6-hydroxymethyldihydropteridine diphosphokinase [Nitrospirae bacterium]|nr:2-amino-4-hydroxy-6-hydroxymethyldihydropteridine diphosphokinase [Nitrospirota bacterium]
MLATAFVGLGSNLGDRHALVRRALEEIDRLPLTRMVRVSRLYETEPVEAEGGTFLNGVAQVLCGLSPHDLLDRLLGIERLLGRERDAVSDCERATSGGPKHAARTMDLDLLWYAGLIVRSPDLILPHPRIHLRRFVLEPLIEIAPDLREPGSGRPYRAYLYR